MQQTLKNRQWLNLFSIALLTVAIIGCAASGRTARVGAGERNAGSGRHVADGTKVSAGTVGRKNDRINNNGTTTDLWVFGVQSSPDLGAKIGAGGIRGIVDLRTFKPTQYAAVLEKYAALDLGFCLTLRWKAPKKNGQKATGADRVDIPPTPAEARKSIEQVLTLLKTPAAKKLAGKLWVQLYNEISGGPGRFSENEEDAMFEYATQLAKRLRKEVPHVKIVGPALTAVTVLDNPNSAELVGIPKLRYKRLLRTIQWSAKYADAVDLHLHAENGAWTNKALKTVRRVLDRQPGGEKIEIVSMEWSCARFKDRTNLPAVRKALAEIFNAMNKHGVTVAAYAGYWPGKYQKQQHQWKSLVDLQGQPREPFHSFFVELAKEQRKSGNK